MNKKINKIKKGDNIKIISGKDKGKIGIVTKIINKKNQLIIKNINIKTKHVKPQKTEEKGSIKKIEVPIHYSNVKTIQVNT
uniref:Large ribosomal subunit protein uL24c n=1 Tax=Ophidocladus simpliciusculus TaxID=1261574 RepID=A0A1Z1MJM2_9FLOR|nr:ribosomal protein L24 [Ophidocladus simpliciusculus]ARW66042.1 ribosomal protein L24 [Ophidocladus simpliciusculus]